MNKKLVIIILLSLISSWAACNFLSRANYDVGPFTVNLEIKGPTGGETVVVIPPLGEIRGATHSFPLKLLVKVKNIDLAGLESFLTDQTKESLLEVFQGTGKQILYRYIGRLLALASLIAALAAFLWDKTFAAAWQGAVVSLVFLTIILFFVVLPFNPAAFGEPQFTGILADTPWFLRILEEGLTGYHNWQSNIVTLTDNLSKYYSSLEELKDLADTEATLRILHVSDIHNNPLAISLISSLAENLPIDFIIDTGDLTDFGTALELNLTGDIASLPLPYVFIPGNHDSPEVIDSLAGIKNVVVLKDEIFSYHGINIMGLADPLSFAKEFVPSRDIKEYQNEYIEQVLNQKASIDILAVHNLAHADLLIGKVPIILYGHNHQQSYSFKDGTHLIGAGSTGAEGLRGWQLAEDAPYTAMVLNFDGDKKLIAVDLLQFSQRSFGFSLQRIFL